MDAIKDIDLRYAPSNRNDLIVQCKHFANTPYSTFISQLKKIENPKIKKLSPQRYILATSLGLTPSNKEEIKKAIEPFCKTTGDIFGQDDLNNLLGKYPQIEKQHFKLWLTSQAVLDRILHSEVFNRTESLIESVKGKLRCYVQNESFDKAIEILQEHHYCIITGIPGIGKTTLAEVLLIHHLGNDYKAFSVANDIDEAFRVFNPHEKQIFYYDDFLGQTSLDEKFNKNEDRRLLDFIDTSRKSTNTRFILTTRE